MKISERFCCKDKPNADPASETSVRGSHHHSAIAEGGYEARALGFSIFTQADSLEELKTMVRDAVSCHFEAGQKPAVIRLHFVGDEVISD